MARNVEFDRESAVKKAMNVFWEKGYNGTSMQDLVDAMQINRSSLYNTIGDKHKLFLECVASYVKDMMDESMEKANKAESPLQALINIINDKATWIVDCENGCLGVKTIFEIAPTDEEVRKMLCKNNDFYMNFLSKIIQKAMDNGQIDASEDPVLMAEYIMMSFTGWKQAYILHSNPIKIKKMSEYLIKSITHH